MPEVDPCFGSSLASPVSLASPQDFVVEALDIDAASLHQPAWSDLVSRGLEPNPFMEPDFCLPAARHLLPSGSLRFLFVWGQGAYDQRRLMAVCPLVRSRLPGWPVAAVWFHDLATLGAPLFSRDEAAPAMLTLLAWIERNSAFKSALRVMALDSEGPTARLLTASARTTGRRIRFLDERRRAILPDIDAATPAGLAALSGRRVKEIQRQRRRLAERGTLRYESALGGVEVRSALDDFLALESLGWKGRAGTALVQDPARAAFVRQMVAQMASRGRCRIDALLLDDRPVAMGILLSSGERDYFWKTAFAEDLAGLSPGVQFVLDLTRAQQGRRSKDFTDSCAIPDHPMIDRLWPGRLAVADALIEIRPGSGIAFLLGLGLEKAWRNGRAGLKRLYARLRRA